MSSLLNAPFLTSSVLVCQLRTSASRDAGSATPERSSATTAAANSLSASRGGSVTQRVIASRPPRSQVPQIVLQGLDRVEVVLRQRIQAGRGRAERIEQRHVDEVVALLAGRDEAARLGHMHAHDAGIPESAPSE